jgi:hypothetical protein
MPEQDDTFQNQLRESGLHVWKTIVHDLYKGVRVDWCPQCNTQIQIYRNGAVIANKQVRLTECDKIFKPDNNLLEK